MKEFKDKVAVVTGGGSGIGRAIARQCVSEGMKVVLADIEERTLSETAGELGREGGAVLPVRTDVSKASDVEALRQRTLTEFGAVHLVCNNAGVGVAAKPIWETTLKDWQWCLNVNLWGVIHGIRTFVPVMLEQGSEGHVVNTASVAGLISAPFVSVYHVTKHAVVTLTESLHAELVLLNSRVKTSVLCPGFVNTRIMDSYRNRPAELGGALQEDEIKVTTMWNAYEQAVDAGIPADSVAHLVFESVRNEKLYILTGDEFDQVIQNRMMAILARENPVMAPELLALLGLSPANTESAGSSGKM